MYDEWFVDGIVGEKEVNCGTALVVVMKAIALLCTLSNRLKYQTLLAHTHTLNFRGKKINAQAIFIGWCSEISTLSRSTFEQWIWMQAKKRLSFAFISSVFRLFSFSLNIFHSNFSLSSFFCYCKFGVGSFITNYVLFIWHSQMLKIHSECCST